MSVLSELKDFWGRSGHRAHLTEALAPTLRELSGTVVDIGGGRHGWGDGTWSNIRRIRVDISPEGKPDVLADAARLPLADGSVDAVIMKEVLEHVREPEHAIREVHRVLRRGGQFVGSVPFMFPVHPDPTDFYRYTADGLRHLLRDFAHVDVAPHGNHFGAAWTLISTRGAAYRTLNPVMRRVLGWTDPRCPEGYTFVARR
jgi:SAM-dependent methyltransferase